MDVILWKTMLFDKHYQSYFLVSYWIASLGITKIYIFSKYFWSPCSTDDNHYSFVFCWVLFFQWPQAFGITLMYFWKHVRLSNKKSLVCKKLGRHFLSDMIFFSWERLADTIFHKNRTTVKYQRKRNME